MSTVSCLPVIGLTDNTFTANQATPARGESMFAKTQHYFSTMLSDVRRSRKLAQSAFPSVRGN
ncbi:MAG: hypothetical protein EPN46_01460 [Candidimonas sp.]|nr:MAG: hypothetical protein EPN77_10300 [Candidimonas sp.]TAM21249.1 MAG: hypothetical protein EPN62_14670 [Candidimonas sp.]TAM80515.1 MAG: hypothetical protein EPN46_01460 [Candidimonas sp.]